MCPTSSLCPQVSLCLECSAAPAPQPSGPCIASSSQAALCTPPHPTPQAFSLTTLTICLLAFLPTSRLQPGSEPPKDSDRASCPLGAPSVPVSRPREASVGEAAAGDQGW